MDRRRRAGDRRDARDPRDERRLADQVAVRPRTGALRRVDDEVAAALADQVDDCRLALLGARDLADLLDLEPGGASVVAVPVVATSSKPSA